MTHQEEEFLNECPAWASQLGINSLLLWNYVKFIMPFDWDERKRFLNEELIANGKLQEGEAEKIERVLRYWDSMSEEPNKLRKCYDGLEERDKRRE